MSAGPVAISLVVPVYFSEPTLAPLADRIAAVAERQGWAWELILVNDGSTDGSWGEIKRLAAARPEVRGLNLLRNFGQHNALLAGIRAARHPLCVTLDDDLQNPPEEIPAMLAHMEGGGHDVVYGYPRRDEHDPWRNATSALVKLILRTVMNYEAARHASSFRVFRTRLRRAFERFDGTYVSIDVLLTWATDRFGAIAVDHRPREVGRSQYSLRKLVRHAVTMALGFSLLPLRLATLLGFAFTLFGGFILAYVLIVYLASGGSIPGFPFLASIISIFSGVQLFSLGVIGEYVGRIHQNSLARPSYVVENEADAPGPDPEP